jgi:hypothetical protein
MPFRAMNLEAGAMGCLFLRWQMMNEMKRKTIKMEE